MKTSVSLFYQYTISKMSEQENMDEIFVKILLMLDTGGRLRYTSKTKMKTIFSF